MAQINGRRLTWLCLAFAIGGGICEGQMVSEAAPAVATPMSVVLKELPGPFDAEWRQQVLGLLPVDASGAATGDAFAVQGQAWPPMLRVWWLGDAQGREDGHYLLTTMRAHGASYAVTMTYSNDGGSRTLHDEDGRPILCYNHDGTAAPAGIGAELQRGNYIHPLYGPSGEVLTDDYPEDHPHHRGINWSWATIAWKGETRDAFAVRGVWARPMASPTFTGAAVLGELHAQNRWMWDDETPIVEEDVVIRAFRAVKGCRFIDVEIRLTAEVEDLAFCGRLEAGYSGFNARMAPGEGQKIVLHNDPPGAKVRRSWADYSAEFGESGGRSGLTILQHEANPRYPSEWREYPALNFFQPAFPGGALIPMPKGQLITLRYRLWVHTGEADEETLCTLWDAYNRPPKAMLEGVTREGPGVVPD